VSAALSTLVDTALAHSPAGGLAVGAVHGDTAEFVCRGTVAGEPVTPDTVMYGASVTKQMVGLLLALGVEAGRATPADRLRRWLPELPGWIDGVRLHHLLHHTSGLPDLTAPSYGVPLSNDEVIGRFRRFDGPSLMEPGRRFSYNNAGYVLLAEALSRLFDRPIAELAGEQIFEPLGMAATRLGGEGQRTAGHPDPPGTVGDGGLWTTVADLARWLTAMNDGTINPRAVRRAERVGHLVDGTALDYAWGVRVVETSDGRRLTHGGTWANWLAKTVRLPHQGVVVAVLSTGGSESGISRLGTDLAAGLASADLRPLPLGYEIARQRPGEDSTRDD
jgi:CubicO group peptidase (beta-lactamase class C family)